MSLFGKTYTQHYLIRKIMVYSSIPVILSFVFPRFLLLPPVLVAQTLHPLTPQTLHVYLLTSFH